MPDPILYTPEDFRLAEAEAEIKRKEAERAAAAQEVKCPRCSANVICTPLTCQHNKTT
jgi:hypothetical protein